MLKWKDIPKADLHVHFEGTLPKSPGSDPIKLVNSKEFKPSSNDVFGNFTYYFLRSVKELNFERTALDYISYAVENSVTHTEFYISPTTHFAVGRGSEELLEGLLVAQEVFARNSLSQRWIFDIVRNSESSGEETLEFISKALAAGITVRSLGLAGDERTNSISMFAKFLEQTGLEVVIHAGETDDATEVERALKLKSLKRLAHALPLAERKDLCELVNNKSVVVEICPCSNQQLVETFSPDDYQKIIDQVDKVVICSDDPGILGKSLGDNYALLESFGVPEEKLLKLAKESLLVVQGSEVSE